MFDGLHSYEIVLMVLGIIMFVVVAAALALYVYRDRRLTTPLPFFMMPVVMIGFPAFQKINCGNNVVLVEKNLAKLAENPGDTASPAIKNWRNQLLDMLVTPQTQAILAFGVGAHQVASLWPGSSGKFVAKLTHPSARDDAALLANWNTWLPQGQTRVTADPGGTKDPTPYGTKFKKTDLAPIPARDLSFAMPKWMGNGDTAWRLPSGNQITWKATAPEG